MSRNRLTQGPEAVCLPQSPAPEASAGGFLFCPFAGAPAQLAVYQWAFEQAKAVVRPSLLERDLLAVWN